MHALLTYSSFLLLLLCNLTIYGQENTAISCSDGLDNDGDGLIDCMDGDCMNLPNEGCFYCGDGISFADSLISYTSGCPIPDPVPEGAIGLSDWDGLDHDRVVSLGEGGVLRLAFTDNLIINSGDGNPDVWIFEAGDVEASNISLRPADAETEQELIQCSCVFDSDADGYYDFGDIGGAISFVDIDAFFTIPLAEGALRFDAIQIIDIVDGDCNNITPGADIDAVCSLNSSNLDCAGVQNGAAIFDDCGECLEADDPNFNQSCADCAGTPNGTAVFDNCGVCLEPADPNFNQSCLDCAGVPNGEAVIDDCGQCLEPADPTFNQSCADCAGIPNGASVIDDCGECLEVGDPDFNQSCIDCAGVMNGPALVDECGECLEADDPNFNQSCLDCAGVPNGASVIDNCGICLEPNDPLFNQSCVEKNIFIPNVFSPNGDGVNDAFKIYADHNLNVTIQTFTVYDRWGGIVHEEQNFDLHSASEAVWWRGNAGGEDAERGNYTYIIEIELANGETRQMSGVVLLLR